MHKMQNEIGCIYKVFTTVLDMVVNISILIISEK